MKRLYTLVCLQCHAGWYSDSDKGRCPHCDRPAVLRGSILVQPIRTTR